MFRIMRRRVRRRRKQINRKSYLEHKENARALAHARLAHYNQFYNFKIGRVSIKNHRGRWGSCSELGNINFNYKIVHLPPEVADYVVVHELCHLKALNHSREFWALVEQTLPNWRPLRKYLFSIAL